MANNEESGEQQLSQLNEMRAAFAAGQCQSVLEVFEALGDLGSIRSGIRIEAIALAARAHLAIGNKKGARQVLRHAWNASLKNHRLYRHVAIACLELGEYRRAIALVEKAAELAEAAASARKEAQQSDADQANEIERD